MNTISNEQWSGTGFMMRLNRRKDCRAGGGARGLSCILALHRRQVGSAQRWMPLTCSIVSLIPNPLTQAVSLPPSRGRASRSLTGAALSGASRSLNTNPKPLSHLKLPSEALASFTCSRVTLSDRCSRASASDRRTSASSWRTCSSTRHTEAKGARALVNKGAWPWQVEVGRGGPAHTRQLRQHR